MSIFHSVEKIFLLMCHSILKRLVVTRTHHYTVSLLLQSVVEEKIQVEIILQDHGGFQIEQQFQVE